jgi:hypothetical protein
MTAQLLKRVGILVAALIAFGGAIELGQPLTDQIIPGFVTTAKAEVGRPLTPVSVGGVARRTARRCAAGVYNC